MAAGGRKGVLEVTKDRAPVGRVLVLYYEDGSSVAIPLTDNSVIRVDGRSFAFKGCLGGFVDKSDAGLLDVFDKEAT